MKRVLIRHRSVLAFVLAALPSCGSPSEDGTQQLQDCQSSLATAQAALVTCQNEKAALAAAVLADPEDDPPNGNGVFAGADFDGGVSVWVDVSAYKVANAGSQFSNEGEGFAWFLESDGTVPANCDFATTLGTPQAYSGPNYRFDTGAGWRSGISGRYEPNKIYVLFVRLRLERKDNPAVTGDFCYFHLFQGGTNVNPWSQASSAGSQP